MNVVFVCNQPEVIGVLLLAVVHVVCVSPEHPVISHQCYYTYYVRKVFKTI